MKGNFQLWGALLVATALASAGIIVRAAPLGGDVAAQQQQQQPEPEEIPSGPIHCIVGPWKVTSECSHTCGNGKQTQEREIFQEPRYGGQPCPALKQVVECNAAVCPPCTHAGCSGTFRKVDGADTTAPRGSPFLRDPRRTRAPAKLTSTGRPSPRDISNVVFNSQQRWLLPRSMRVNTLTYYFGRFLHNDMVSFSIPKDVKCRTQGEEAPIPVPAGDPWFDAQHTGNEHINFTRTSYCKSSDGSREYRNGVTGAIDASNIYGSDEETARQLRTMSGGRMKTEDGMPPVDPETKHCQNGQCWKLGDSRDNENAVISAIHAVFLMEHNRVAAATLRDHKDWTDEQVYQEARKWVIARIQAIAYTEYLPALLGDSCPSISVPLGPKASGIASQISLEFASMADLFHYSGLPDEVVLIHPSNSSTAAVVQVADAMMAPSLVNKTSLPQILLGVSRQQARTLDAVISDSLRNKKFNTDLAGALEEESDGHYMDLVSEIIQRGRDHGVVTYNEMRASLGLPVIQSFQEISDRQGLSRRLEAMYGHIDKLDAFVGGMAESPSHGSLLGSTFSKVLCEQFSRTRAADPYFYERYDEFTGKQKRSLTRQTTFTDIIALNLPQLSHREMDSNAFGFHSHDTQHCTVTEWQNDGACTRACGSGRQIQRRHIMSQPASGGIRCPPLKRVIECNAQPCGDLTQQRTHCEVTEWRSWGECSVKCGGGTQKEYRKVTQHPSNGGQVCPPLFRIVGCNQIDCETTQPSVAAKYEKKADNNEEQDEETDNDDEDAVDDEDGAANDDQDIDDGKKFIPRVPCEVSEWATLGPCSKTCGGKGTRKQYRTILQIPTERNSKCPPTSRDVPCFNERPCPGDVIAPSKKTVVNVEREVPAEKASDFKWRCEDGPVVSGKTVEECSKKPHGFSCVLATTSGKECFTTCKRGQWSKINCGRDVPNKMLVEEEEENAPLRDEDAVDEDAAKPSKLTRAKDRTNKEAFENDPVNKEISKKQRFSKNENPTAAADENRAYSYSFLLVILALVGTLIVGSVVIYQRRAARREAEAEFDDLPKFHGYSKGKGMQLYHPKVLRKNSGILPLPTVTEEQQQQCPPSDLVNKRVGYNRRASEKWFML